MTDISKMTDRELGPEILNVSDGTADQLGRKARELLCPPARPDVEKNAVHAIRLTPAEIQSGYDRVKWAESLIRQLHVDHDGRNSWLLNHGVSSDAECIRAQWADKTKQVPPKPNGPEIFAPPAPKVDPDAKAKELAWLHWRTLIPTTAFQSADDFWVHGCHPIGWHDSWRAVAGKVD